MTTRKKGSATSCGKVDAAPQNERQPTAIPTLPDTASDVKHDPSENSEARHGPPQGDRHGRLAVDPSPPPSDEEPNDIAAEQAALGAVLAEAPAEAVDLVLQLPLEAFYRDAHRWIQTAMKAVAERGDPLTFVTVGNALRERKSPSSGWANMLEFIGGGEYLMALISECAGTHPDQVAAHCAILTRALAARKARAVTEELAALARSTTDTAEVIRRGMERLAGIDVGAGGVPDLVTYEEVAATVAGTKWLWPSWIPRGHLSMIMAPVGAGKSYAAMMLAACVTECLPWPDSAPANDEPGRVLWLDFEAGEATLAERLRNAGLTMSRFLSPPMDANKPLSDPKAVDRLRLWIAKEQPTMVVVDSLRYAFPGVDENSSLIADYLRPLAVLAAQFGIAFLLVHHSNRPDERRIGENAWLLDVLSARGSTTITALTRAVMALDKPDAGDDSLRLHVCKANLAAKPDPIGVTIADGDGLNWHRQPPRRPVEMTARDVAVEFLQRELQDKPVHNQELQERAKEEGIARATLFRAKNRLQLVSNDGLWGLPATPGT